MSRRPTARLLLASTSLAIALGGCSTVPKDAPVAPPAAAAPTSPPPLAYETFDAVWLTIDEKHFDQTHNGVDWIAMREEFRPQVASVRSDAELRVLLDAMIARLGQSHFGIIPREVASSAPVPDPPVSDPDAQAASAPAPPHADATTGAIAPVESRAHIGDDHESGSGGDLGVTFRLVEGAIVTVAPRPGGPADRAGIGAGWTLLEIDGAPVMPRGADDTPRSASVGAAGVESMMLRYHREAAAAHAVHATPGGSIQLTFLASNANSSTSDARRTVTVVAEKFDGETVKFGNLPPLETYVVDRPLTTAELARAGISGNAAGDEITIGIIAFNIWMLPAVTKLDAAVDRFRGADGVILDLRGNPGGVGAMALGVGGHFLAEPLSLGKMITPQTTMEFRVNPRTVTADGRLVAPYSGPLAILVDPLTASTSEIFAAGLQDMGRARVFGQTSAGAALPSIATELPNGDVLQYAMADFVTPKGNHIEGHGVVPDVTIELTLDALRRDPDPVLTEAARWIAAEHRNRATRSPESRGS